MESTTIRNSITTSASINDDNLSNTHITSTLYDGNKLGVIVKHTHMIQITPIMQTSIASTADIYSRNGGYQHAIGSRKHSAVTELHHHQQFSPIKQIWRHPPQFSAERFEEHKSERHYAQEIMC
jgi:beta-lactamase class D